MESLSGIEGSLAWPVNTIPEMPAKLPQLSTSLEQFTKMTEVVIDAFEGGYYHPNMLSRFNAADQKKLKDSGETMYGLDRKAGAQLAKYAEWYEFWKIVDEGKARFPGLWKYNAKNVPDAPRLKKLASAIMYKWFSYLSGKYILITSMDEIANDDRLIIHFSYASWNGEGWFQRYANALNEAIKKYPGKKEEIFTEAFKERLYACKYIKMGNRMIKTAIPNVVIRQQGTNMMALFKRMKLI